MKIVTSLSFQGQCREAFEFYAKVLGGKITAFHSVGQIAIGRPGRDEDRRRRRVLRGHQHRDTDAYEEAE